MTIIEKLHEIEKRGIPYTLNWRNAGVSITFFEPERTGLPNPLDLMPINSDAWRRGLVTYRYYDSFEECIDAEYERLKAKPEMDFRVSVRAD